MPTSPPNPSQSTVSHPPGPHHPGGPQKRTRSERVASVVAKPSILGRFWTELRRENKLTLLCLMLLCVFGICIVITAWDPPFGFRTHTLASRNVICATPFSVPNEQGQREAETEARSKVNHIYVNDPESLIQLREGLRNTVAALLNAESYDALSPADKEEWNGFLRPAQESSAATDEVAADPKAAFDAFRAALKEGYPVFGDFESALRRAFSPMEINGLISKLDFSPLEGNQQQILVYPLGDDPDVAKPVLVGDVLIEDGSKFLQAFTREIRGSRNDKMLAELLFNWIRPKLGPQFKDTLRKDVEATDELRRQMLADIPEVRREYLPGETLVQAGKSIGPVEMKLLQTEYREAMKQRSFDTRTLRFCAVAALLTILFILGWAFIYRRERRKPKTLRGTLVMFATLLATIAFGCFLQYCASTIGQWELVPLLLFVQCIAIMYSWELAIVMATTAVVSFSLADGTGIGVPLILLGTSVAAATQLGRLRSRTKLIVVGFFSGCVVFALTLAVGLVDGRPVDIYLLREAAFNIAWPLIAAFILTGLLPFIERPFGIVTDMSLLELVDVSHPLLQELIRRAPATYSHSMQVGTVAEAAADAIGARGLMTRVGAYFHDIGKIFKPEYFAENQGDGGNLHNTLEPRMSTLIIVAHVKDGVDLARQHRLPKPLIDLIEQHHGTSLVSFFYGRAAKQSKESGHGDHVEEGSFRYPGPRPLSKEAGILMLADAAESACRSFDSNSPGRIESMVRQITKSKLDDGQFDECGMTLKELRTVENSIINSLIAIKHGRIRYPGQESIEAQGRLLDREREGLTAIHPPPEKADTQRNVS